MTNYQFRWPKELDDRLRELWPVSSLAEMSREFGLSTRRIRDRAKRLKLPVATYRERLTPSKAEWVEIASQIAREANLRPSDVLAGCRYKAAVRARWAAWKEVLDRYPNYSIAGVARASGHDWTTVLYGLRRLNGISAPSMRKASYRATCRRRLEVTAISSGNDFLVAGGVRPD